MYFSFLVVAIEEYLRRLHQTRRPHDPYHLTEQSVVPPHPFVYLHHPPLSPEKYAIIVPLNYLTTRYLTLLFVVIRVDKEMTLIRLSRMQNLHRHLSLLHLV